MSTLAIPAFNAFRLTQSTFCIIEHSDVYDEHPYIYLKFLNDSTVLILDTGCGGKTMKPDIALTSLREFIETVEIADNGGRPLNESGKKGYIVVLSHCHYDHILGIKDFTSDSQIIVSGHCPEFNSGSNLPEHSLCLSLGIETPEYTPTFVANRYTLQALDGNVNVLHTPGHTPDELALWDEGDHMLFVGDTLYEWSPIIFPSEGSLVAWFETVKTLLDLVEPYANAQISCGHVTAGRPAKEVLLGAKTFMEDVVRGTIKPERTFEKRGEENIYCIRGDQRFSLICPTRLVGEVRQRAKMEWGSA
ncbi:beta-lactamase-like protein [Cristinia sonorae]|uniref:Beta-lactamase-like protein n=1 Tax=Cristinia sonorae TaxID=1940300 RepID=A0A8K0UMJ1_9AGAR|nr:beta-lactamase-like protein [Cristinia sonorae]